jgi:Flp pilus assembly protein TadG
VTPPPDVSAERGTITLWILGLCVLLLPLGGLGLDLGRAFSARRSLGATADAAALAGAGALDIAAYRADGSVRLDPTRAEARARRSVAEQLDADAVRAVRVHVETDTITVEVEGDVELTLLRLLRGAEPFTVTASATARPHVRP